MQIRASRASLNPDLIKELINLHRLFDPLLPVRGDQAERFGFTFIKDQINLVGFTGFRLKNNKNIARCGSVI